MKQPVSSRILSKSKSYQSPRSRRLEYVYQNNQQKLTQYHQASRPDNQIDARLLNSGLYIVSTPIGNLEDITLRALDVLERADSIICEDTRITRRLLTPFAINTPLVSYHDHNASKLRPQILKRIREGEVLALVSDAGTPAISDPGYKLVRDCIKAELLVTVIPGATASISGLVLSGMPTDRFLFQGFLPVKPKQRQKTLGELSGITVSLVFYESPGRLVRSLKDMLDVLGNRPAAVLRELTKLHEEVCRGTLKELAEHYGENKRPKGELMVVVGPMQKKPFTDDSELRSVLIEKLNNLSVRDAVAEVALVTNQPRQKIYEIAIGLKDKS